MAKFKLPNRKWYTLQQAIKRIHTLTGETLEIADLLHYWHSEQLDISVYFLNYPARTAIGNIDFYQKDKIMLNVFTSSAEYEIENIFSISESPKLVFENEHVKNEIILIESEKDISGEYRIKGFMSIASNAVNSPQEEKEIIEKGICLNRLIYLFSPEMKEEKTIVMFSYQEDEEMYLSLDNLCILDKDLDAFLSGKVEKKNISEIINAPAPKTRNAQAEFIYHLLCKCYGKPKANKIRAEIENQYSKIRSDFETEGWNLPSGKAVQKWINDFID